MNGRSVTIRPLTLDFLRLTKYLNGMIPYLLPTNRLLICCFKNGAV